MAKGIICDRCGAVSTHYGDVNEITLTPYVGVKTTVASQARSCDLCKDCTETLMQYINNEVQMIVFKDSEAAGDEPLPM